MVSPLDAATRWAARLERIHVLEHERLADRDRAMVTAVRAGARLSEVADAAGVTRAAVSLAVRKTLPARTGRGGSYERRRGVAAALSSVSEAAARLSEARSEIDALRARRDGAIAAAVAQGTGIRQAARTLGMAAPTVSAIARSERDPEGLL